MRPVDFTLHSPATAAEAVALASTHGEDAVVLAGGQSLMPLLNMRLVRPSHVIDLSQATELAYIRDGHDGSVRIGAMSRQCQLIESRLARSAAPLLAHAAGFVGQPSTRTRGTVGGSVAFGSNVSEICVALLSVGATIGVRSHEGEKRIGADAFFVDYLTTALPKAGLVTEIAVVAMRARSAWGFAELKLRACDFPIVIAAVVVERDAHGICRESRIALGGVAATPVRSTAAEAALVGRPLDRESIDTACAAAVAVLDPPSDLHASADYRRRAAAVKLRAALEDAARHTGEAP